MHRLLRGCAARTPTDARRLRGWAWQTALVSLTLLWSVLIGFVVSTVVGLVFGMWPAVRASRQHPVEALRYE